MGRVIGIVLLLNLFSLVGFAQPIIKISGVVTNEFNQVLPAVTVTVLGQNQAVLTDNSGSYTTYSKTTDFTLKFNLLGYSPELVVFKEKKAGKIVFNTKLKVSVNELEQVTITSKQDQLSNTTSINITDINTIPSASGNFETILKTLPGVSVNNELTAQYSVRGGNFDENLMYVNDIEISRPSFFRNGQQEGLSFVNSDLVSRARFSAGGFESKYGDKLSSVLDVQYARPDTNEILASVGVLGSSLSLKQGYKSGYLLVGLRYKNNRSVLAKQDVKGYYSPNFGDFQLLFQQNIYPKLTIDVLANLNGGRFKMIPDSRQTDFGTVSTNLHLNVNFTGEENTSYISSGGAFTATYRPTAFMAVKWINSYFNTYENEQTNILGSYYLDELVLNRPNPGNISGSQSVGAYYTYISNGLRSEFLSTELKIDKNLGSHVFSLGVKLQQKRYHESLDELNQVSQSNSSNLYIDNFLKGENKVNIENYAAYIQDSYSIGDHTELQIGVRGVYNSIMKHFSMRPRLLLAYRPESDTKIVRLTAGIYSQDPDYLTIKNMDGSLVLNQNAQRVYSTSLGYDYAFNALGTRLKFSSEIYLKYSDRIIPYIVDNLKTRFFANQVAKGYIYGADFTLGGEFVKDLVSYFRVSLLKANQDIAGDSYQLATPTGVQNVYPGYLKRPTDQRINFSVFFQDRLLTSPSYKVHLNLLYGSRMPIGAPNSKFYTDNFRIPAYKRADIGFSKDFLEESINRKSPSFRNKFSSLIAFVEIFNFLNINNTASYLWIKDVNGAQYAIPNYLTGRQLNFKIIAKFKGK